MKTHYVGRTHTCAAPQVQARPKLQHRSFAPCGRRAHTCAAPQVQARPPLRGWVLLVCLSALVAACAPGGAAPTVPDPLEEATLSAPDQLEGAAAEATAIIQRAEATAVVLKAQAAATALIEQAGNAPSTPVPATAAPPIPVSPASEPLATAEPVTQAVELLGVGYAADGALLVVQFKASPQEARRTMRQGTISVTDEASGALYNEVPNMPIIGPLIGHPARADQPGYAMLVNTPPGLPPGSLVTVVLGNFKQEHVRTLLIDRTSKSLLPK